MRARRAEQDALARREAEYQKGAAEPKLEPEAPELGAGA
jgi:hypothetical protein